MFRIYPVASGNPLEGTVVLRAVSSVRLAYSTICLLPVLMTVQPGVIEQLVLYRDMQSYITIVTTINEEVPTPGSPPDTDIQPQGNNGELHGDTSDAETLTDDTVPVAIAQPLEPWLPARPSSDVFANGVAHDLVEEVTREADITELGMASPPPPSSCSDHPSGITHPSLYSTNSQGTQPPLSDINPPPALNVPRHPVSTPPLLSRHTLDPNFV